MRLTSDYRALEKIANDPTILPYVSDDGPLDFSKITNAVFVMFGDGGFIFQMVRPVMWEAHAVFRRKNGSALPKAEAALGAMFRRPDCSAVVARIPVKNRAAALLAKRAGFKPLPVKDSWRGDELKCFGITKEEWNKCHPQ